MDTSALFRPFTYKSLHLPNRVVMAPMTRSFSPNGVPTAEVATYYERRAQGGVGLIVTEGTFIERAGAGNDPNVPSFHGAESLQAWQRVLKAVHGAGGRIAPQLWHVGAVPHHELPLNPAMEGPSGLASPGKPLGKAMSDADVADAISAYARAAVHAKELGFDAIELHGAHGYLIDQFFWEGTNLRTDAFGGPSLPERTHFAVEMLKAIRRAVGEDYVVILRLSQWKLQDYAVKLANTPEEMSAWLQPLADAGADIFHCSQRRFWEPEFEGSDLNFAGWAKKLTGKPSITVGSVGLSGDFINAFGGERSQPASIDSLLHRFEREEFDLVAVGRALLNDPQWLQKVRDGRTDELAPFTREALATLR
jgi:2,4-dienoyl-CoA reductase-like NADH-dependent reductase (Old Yellow Enzyme family)